MSKEANSIISIPDFEVVQNDALSALILWKYVDAYVEQAEKCKGPNLAEILIVLPAVYNERFSEVVHNKKFSGGLYRAWDEDRTFALGLQTRVIEMLDQTMKALNLAFGSELLYFDSSTAQLFCNPKQKPGLPTGNSVLPLFQAAKRLGIWCFELKFEQICTLLNVRY